MKINYRLRWMRRLHKHSDIVGWEELTYEFMSPLQGKIIELLKEADVRLIQVECL